MCGSRGGEQGVRTPMRGSRNFRQGVQVSLTKKALTFFFFFSSYFTEFKWSISKKSIIFQGSRGGPTFSRGGGGGVQLFPGGGSNCLFPIETHITCDFPGGSRPPVPPLDPHLIPPPPPPPPKNHKNIGFLSNTGPDPLILPPLIN